MKTMLLLGLVLAGTAACQRNGVPTTTDASEVAQWGIHKKVLFVVGTANRLGSRQGRELSDTNAVALLTGLFSESGYCIVLPRKGPSLQLTLTDFVERCRYQRGHYTFERTTLNHYTNFENGLEGKLVADNQILHDVDFFTVTGQPVAAQESFVKQPISKQPAGDFWQIYTITLRER